MNIMEPAISFSKRGLNTMGKYVFSLAAQDEASKILKIYQDLIGIPGCHWNIYYPDKEIVESDIKNGWLYTLKDDDKILGVVSAGPLNPPDQDMGHLTWELENPCLLGRLAVVRELLGQGIGTIVLEHTIKLAKGKGFDGIVMLVGKTNTAALALYNKYGFEICGETHMYDHDYYCYQMRFA